MGAFNVNLIKMTFLLFAYGSLVNEKSRKQTLKNSNPVAENVILDGYVRKMNAPYLDGYLYLNLVPSIGSSVEGVIINIGDEDAVALAKREEGSKLVDVTSGLSKNFGQKVFAYMQADKKYTNMPIMQSYINTCLKSVPKERRKKWLDETVIENEVVNDTEGPLYEFSA